MVITGAETRNIADPQLRGATRINEGPQGTMKTDGLKVQPSDTAIAAVRAMIEFISGSMLTLQIAAEVQVQVLK